MDGVLAPRAPARFLFCLSGSSQTVPSGGLGARHHLRWTIREKRELGSIPRLLRVIMARGMDGYATARSVSELCFEPVAPAPCRFCGERASSGQIGGLSFFFLPRDGVVFFNPVDFKRTYTVGHVIWSPGESCSHKETLGTGTLFHCLILCVFSIITCSMHRIDRLVVTIRRRASEMTTLPCRHRHRNR